MNFKNIHNRVSSLIPKSFFLLFFLTPLVLNPKTSEIFEFNKIVLTYLFTTTILFLWVVKIILEKRIIFKKTALDIPILIFLGSQLLSTFISIDPRVSLLGYYSRFHGGLISLFCYSILYWAWVSNMNKKETVRAINFLIFSGVLVSLYGVLEHFGIDKEIWVQDVQNRVFSTLGQPNWLAAFVVAISPIAWVGFLKNKKIVFKDISSKTLWFVISVIFFITLLYTKSRSGLLGFSAAVLVFLISFFYQLGSKKTALKTKGKSFFVLILSLVAISILVGTPWTKGIFAPKQDQNINKESEFENLPTSPALEVGGTESGEIRKIVWKGAFDIWKKYPLLGSGVETFAYAYYGSRPSEHNLVSEWDFVYNKAHNEYLNFLATTGSVGLISYLFLLGSIFLYLLTKNKKGKENILAVYNFKAKKDFEIFKSWNFGLAFLAGFGSIAVTNFFGFSVVVIFILMLLYPAFSYTLKVENNEDINISDKKSIYQNTLIPLTGLIFIYLVYVIFKYYFADISYNKGRLLDTTNPISANIYLEKAVKSFSKEPVFLMELSKSYANSSLLKIDGASYQEAEDFAQKAIEKYQQATILSPNNPNIFRSGSVIYLKLSTLDPNYLLEAEKELEKAILLAPTDAKLIYNLGLTRARTGDLEGSKAAFEKAVEEKYDYVNARLALGLVLYDLGNKPGAIKELEFILENIDPDNSLVKQQLEQIR